MQHTQKNVKRNKSNQIGAVEFEFWIEVFAFLLAYYYSMFVPQITGRPRYTAWG
jgi:hypothetical protein